MGLRSIGYGRLFDEYLEEPEDVEAFMDADDQQILARFSWVGLGDGCFRRLPAIEDL